MVLQTGHAEAPEKSEVSAIVITLNVSSLQILTGNAVLVTKYYTALSPFLVITAFVRIYST